MTSVVAEAPCRARKPPTTPPLPRTGKRCLPRSRKSRTTWQVCTIWRRRRCSSSKPLKPPSRRSALELDRYKAGTDSYLSVITTQTIALSDQQTAITILQRRMSAAIDLIKDLGGGWDASTLPSGESLRSIALADPKNTPSVALPAGK